MWSHSLGAAIEIAALISGHGDSSPGSLQKMFFGALVVLFSRYTKGIVTLTFHIVFIVWPRNTNSTVGNIFMEYMVKEGKNGTC